MTDSIWDVVQLPSCSQMTFGGWPRTTLRVLKSSSLDTIAKPFCRAYSHLIIGRTVETGGLHVARAGEQISQAGCQFRRQILVEKQLHATATSMLRSRSAAKAKHAWISSRVKYGKSLRISS